VPPSKISTEKIETIPLNLIKLELFSMGFNRQSVEELFLSEGDAIQDSNHAVELLVKG
jgi:hypothetical protein